MAKTFSERVFSDQTKLFDPEKVGYPVHIIGAGGIGNMLVQLLAKMGFPEIHVWDDDIFEARNGPTEVAYSEALVGQPKVEAARDIVEHLVGDSVILVLHNERVTKDTELTGYVICGVDSMKSREEIWDAIQANFVDIPLYIDARSAGEEVQVLSVVPFDSEDVQAYETWLFNDTEASKLECGARNIGYIATYIATIVSYNLTRFIRGEEIEFNIMRDLSRNI